jgi:hypothetical protein
MRRFLTILVFCPAFCLATGCGGDGRKPVFPVEGQVLWKGKPPVGAQIVFHPVGQTGPDALNPAGQVDSQGKFTLTTYKANDGAPAGDYQVTIDHWESPGRDLPAVNKLPPEFSRVASSGLSAKVVEGPNQLPTFELKK